MINPIGDPAAVEALAVRYRREADRVESLYADSDRRLDGTLWVGRRATGTRSRLGGRRSEVLGQAAELRSIARDLDRHAVWMSETIRELEGLERRVRAWAASHPPDPTTPGPDASLIGHYPPHCDVAWRSLAARLRAVGAAV